MRRVLVCLTNMSRKTYHSLPGQGLGPLGICGPSRASASTPVTGWGQPLPFPRLSAPSGGGLGRLWTAGSQLHEQIHCRRPPRLPSPALSHLSGPRPPYPALTPTQTGTIYLHQLLPAARPSANRSYLYPVGLTLGSPSLTPSLISWTPPGRRPHW